MGKFDEKACRRRERTKFADSTSRSRRPPIWPRDLISSMSQRLDSLAPRVTPRGRAQRAGTRNSVKGHSGNKTGVKLPRFRYQTGNIRRDSQDKVTEAPATAAPLGSVIVPRRDERPCLLDHRAFWPRHRGVGTSHHRSLNARRTAATGGDMRSITSAEFKTERTASTGSAGEYQFLFLAPGTYTLTASASGFQRYEQKGLALQEA